MNFNAAEAALADKTSGAWVNFLDSMNSTDELYALREYLQANHPERDNDLIGSYEKWLACWPNPKLTDEFRQKFPLVSAKLDTPQKIRVFLRGVEFRSYYPRVDENMMGRVFEDIIYRHEILGEKKVVYTHYRGSTFGDALRIVYHTQLQAWTLTDLMLPDCKTKGFGSKGLSLDWRSEEERKAAGERY